MIKILSTILLLAVATPVLRAQVVLAEDFSAGVPPTGWTVVEVASAPSDTWTSASGRAAHYWGTAGGGSLSVDNFLVSPVVDLSAITGANLSFWGTTGWASYLANHPGSNGDGISNVEVSNDGGLTWTTVWTDNAFWDNQVYNPCIDLSAYDGQAAVQFQFHYYGWAAHEWQLDDVVLEGGGCGQSSLWLSSTPLVGGQVATFTVDHAQPNGLVALAYSLAGPGPLTTQFGIADISAPYTILPYLSVDAAGTAFHPTPIPLIASGLTVYMQGADLSVNMLTNSLALTIL